MQSRGRLHARVAPLGVALEVPMVGGPGSTALRFEAAVSHCIKRSPWGESSGVACACRSCRVMPTRRRVAAVWLPIRFPATAMATPVFASAAEMYVFLPPDAQALVRRFTEHPVAACLWSSRRWLSRWGVANGRYEDWQERRDRMLVEGLPARIMGAIVRDDFFAVYVESDEAFLIRSHQERDFALHLTIGYASDWYEGMAEDAASRINERWQGRDVVLRIAWMGHGGAAFLAADESLALDVDIEWFHRRGYYSERGLHISL